MGERSAYFKDWYEQNKDGLAEKRKHAYDENPEYRDKVLSQSAKYREQQRNIPRLKMPRFHTPREYVAGDGGKVVLYSIGAFAVYIQRSVQSIGQWERNGVIPQTPYRSGKRGFRFYTAEQMDAVRDAVGNKRRFYPVDPVMTECINQRWVDSGVPVGCDDGIDEAIRQTKTQR